MAFGISSKGRVSPIAIDFGADAVKLLQIVPDDTSQLVAAGRAVIPEEARGDMPSRMAFIEEAVKQLIHELPFRGRKAICAIPGFQTLAHNFMVARCDPEDIDALIELQLRERLGIEPTRMILRNFHAVDHYRHGAARSDVVCLAAKRDLVMQYLALAGRCRLEVVGMHPEPTCVLHAFGDLIDDEPECVCFVDMGAATTKVVVCKGEKLLLLKTIHAAGDHYNQMLARSGNMSFDQARNTRAKGGGELEWESSQSVATSGVLKGKESEQRADEVTRTILDELRLVVRHHNGRHPDSPIQRFVLVGGEANRGALCGKIADTLGAAVQRGDPFEGLYKVGSEDTTKGVNADAPQPGWAVAKGLCFSEANL